MNASMEHDDDNKSVEQESLTHPPLLDKHIQFDMFSIAETKQNDETNGKNSCSTPPKPVNDATQDTPNSTERKNEPLLGKGRAIKMLKSFGSQQKPIKEFHTNVLKTPTTKDNHRPKREKKSLTPLEKAKETISQIEELKKFKDRTIPTYFCENVTIHSIKDAHPSIETKVDNKKSECLDKSNNDHESELVCAKTPVDSLELLKVYNNVDVDKQSDDEDVCTDKDEQLLYESLSNNLLDACITKNKLPIAFDLKTKRAKEKRVKRISSDSRSSEKKRKRRNKERSRKKSKDSSSRRSSSASGRKRSKKKRQSNRDDEPSSEKLVSLEGHSGEYIYERFTKTLPVIKYSANPYVMRQLLANGIANTSPKRKKRSSSKSTIQKRKRKKSSNGGKVKEKSRSRSKVDKSAKKQRKELEKSLDNLMTIVKKEKVFDGDAVSNTMDEKSSNGEEYKSKWDNWNNWDGTDELAGSSMENLLPLDTIPLQLNVPKQDRTTLFTNDQTTPRMNPCDPPVETPIIIDLPPVKCQQPKELENGKLIKSLTSCIIKSSPDNRPIDECITKISPKEPIQKKVEPPIAQLYDEYEQFIMSCTVADEHNRSNGDKSSITSSLYDETVTSNDGDEKLEALKISLEKKLHEIEHTHVEQPADVKLSELKIPSPKPPLEVTKESSESSSSSSSSSSSDSSSSSESEPSEERRRKPRKPNTKSTMALDLVDDIFDLKTGIADDDDLSDNELLSKVERLKQQFSEKRKALADKRKLLPNDASSPDSLTKPDDALLLSPEKRSAISLKIGGNKPTTMLKPVMFDDDDFTDTLLLEATPNALVRSKETNKLLIERVIEPGVGLVSSSNSSSLASEIINTKVSRIGRMPNNATKSNKKLTSTDNDSGFVDTAQMKNYLNNAVSSLGSSESIASKTSGSIDGNVSPVTNRRGSSMRPSTSPTRFDKRETNDSKSRPLSPYHRSRSKESSKRHSSPQSNRHRSPRPRKRSSLRSPSPIRKRSRGSPRRSRSPRRPSPRRLRRSLSPRSKRTGSPIRGRPRTPPEPHTNRKWEPPIAADYTSSTKHIHGCESNVPQPICRLENSHSSPWPNDGSSAFAQYGYQHIPPLSPKRSLDDRIANAFNHSDQSYEFHQASGPYMGHFQYSNDNASKIPVLNSQENYYFQPQNLQTIPPHPTQPQHVPRLHAPHMHVQHIAPNQPSPQQQQQRTFPNLIEIRQSNVDAERTPFVVKGNVLEIVPKTEPVVPESPNDSVQMKVDAEHSNEIKPEVKVELTEEEIERRELKKAELKLKRKQERDKRQLERFMRKEKLKLEIKHLMEVGVHTAEVKKATYNPNAIGGKSILRVNAASVSKKSVLFADGVAPGDGTSTSGGEDVAPLLRDRNKRMTKRKLDSKRRRARREASVIKKETVPPVVEITPFIDPELENMPPPPPPDGNPPARLAQPRLKSTPKLIYFHYDPRSNAMYVSPYPTEFNIPSYPSIESSPAPSTPDLIQKPKVCFIQPPAFEQQQQQQQQPVQAQPTNPSLPNQNPSMVNNLIGLTEPSIPMKSIHPQQPSSLPTSPASQNYNRVPVPIINQHPVPMQPIQTAPVPTHWENSGFQTQHPPPPVVKSSDIYLHNQPIRPHTRFNNVNNIVQPRPAHNTAWDQQRHPNPLFHNQIHAPQPPPAAFHPRPIHPRFHQPINVNVPSHQHQNNFAFNANYNYGNGNNSNTPWNNQYRNNH